MHPYDVKVVDSEHEFALVGLGFANPQIRNLYGPAAAHTEAIHGVADAPQVLPDTKYWPFQAYETPESASGEAGTHATGGHSPQVHVSH